MTEYKRKRGDRRDGRWIKDGTGLAVIMANILPNRADSEVNLTDTIDCTELMKWLEKKNENATADNKVTIFHCFLMAMTKMVNERPYMNRFVQGRRIYERYDISLSFVAKKRFQDHAEESLMVLVPKMTDTIDDITHKVIGDVRETRKSETASGGIDELLTKLAKLPRPILMLVAKTIRILDFWGMNLKAITDGDPNYTTILASNLGSIKCPAVYHHLNNYGTNSIMVTIGTLHKAPMLMEDGTTEIRDVVDFSATLDERIADGFYFARSLKLIKYIFANPEMLEQPIEVPSEFDYK